MNATSSGLSGDTSCPCAGEQLWLFATPADAVRFSSDGDGVLEVSLEGTRAWSAAFTDRPVRLATAIKTDELLMSEVYDEVRRDMVLAWVVQNESMSLPFQVGALQPGDEAGTYRIRLLIGDDFNSSAFGLSSGGNVNVLSLGDRGPMSGVSEYPVLFSDGSGAVPAAFQDANCVCNGTGMPISSINRTGSNFVVSSRRGTLEPNGTTWNLELEDTHPLSIYMGPGGYGYETTSKILNNEAWNGTLPNVDLSWDDMTVSFEVLDFASAADDSDSYQLSLSALKEVGNKVAPSRLGSLVGNSSMVIDNPVLFVDMR